MAIDGAGENRLPGVLEDEVYLGDRTHWRVRVAGELFIVAEGVLAPQRRRGDDRRGDVRAGCGAEAGGDDVRARAGVLLLPAVLALGLLFVAPQALMLEASLGRRSAYGGVVHDWSLANYVRAAEPLYLEILGRSLVLALATTAVCLALGYPMAYWLARRVPPTLAERAAGAGHPALLDQLPRAHVRVDVHPPQRGDPERGAVRGGPAGA